MKKGNPRVLLIVCCVVVIVAGFSGVVLQMNVSVTTTMSRPNDVEHQNRSRSQGITVRKVNGAMQGKMSRNRIVGEPPDRITCNRSHPSYDICTINGPTIFDPRESTFFLIGSTPSSHPVTRHKIRPYPRKWENFTMSKIREFTITKETPAIRCDVTHEVPALVFSVGSFTGNFFHEFNDGFIPLYITVNSVYPDREFVMLVEKARDGWMRKYADLLRAFSRHRIVDIDRTDITHCFPSATLGLISHGFMAINPNLIPNSRSFADFRSFIDKAYMPGTYDPLPKSTRTNSRPRLVLATRSGGVGRLILNQDELKKEAEKVGFEVILFEPTQATRLRDAHALINSSHALIGVHGAALTHHLFLRRGASFVQVVPIGAEWVAGVCFGKSASKLGLNYVEYRARADESSLAEKYGKDHRLVKDPGGSRGKGWDVKVMDIYLKEQNVRLDLLRFGRLLKVVFDQAHRFMDLEG